MPREHEAEWKKAKAHAREQYPDLGEGDDRFWRLVQAIYRKMTGGQVVKKSVSLVVSGRGSTRTARVPFRLSMCKAVSIGSAYGSARKGHSISVTLVPPAGQTASEAETWAGSLLERLKSEKHDGRCFIDPWILQSVNDAQPAMTASSDKPRVSLQNLDCGDCRRIARKLRAELGIEADLVAKSQIKGHYRTIEGGRRVYVAPHQDKRVSNGGHTCRDGKGNLCSKPATVALVAPDGKQIPGNGMCAAHASEVVDEYRQKLGQKWTTKNLDDNEPKTDDDGGLKALDREAAVRLIREHGAHGALAHQKARMDRLKADPKFDAGKEGHRIVLEHRQAVHDLVDGHVSGRARLQEAEAPAHLIQNGQQLVSQLKRLLPYSGRSPEEIEETLRPVEAALASRDAHAIVEAMEAATPKLWRAQKEMADKEKGSPR